MANTRKIKEIHQIDSALIQLRYIAFFVLLFLLPHFVLALGSDSLLKNLRSVPISNGRKIILQSKIETLKEVSIKKNNSHYQLKKGSFSQSDSIELEVNKTNQIIATYFYYDSTLVYNYSNRVEAFTQHFKSGGKEIQFISQNNSVKVTKWEDLRTIFELVEVTKNNSIFFYAVTFDKELYLKGIKSNIDFKKNDNSLELLKILGLL